MSDRTMVGRTGRPEDIANAVVFLAAPESGFDSAGAYHWWWADGLYRARL